MRVAAIDVGTNTTRLLVAEEQPGGFRSIDRRMVITRLGQGVDRRRVLAPEALKRTLATIADYAAACGDLGVERLRVTGTSAVRDAHNRSEFMEAVKLLTGAEPELLSGDREARATYRGAVSDLDPGEPVLVVDIGGGSTELIFGRHEPEHLVSLDFGSVRMFEKHLASDPPTLAELEAVRAEVTSGLDEAKATLPVPPGTRMVGVAGTITQLAAINAGVAVYDPDVTHHAILSHGDVRRLARRLATLPYEQRKKVKALVPGRADVIVAGAEILLTIMESFDVPEVLTSEKDILDGLVMGLLADEDPS